jgi:hypothetical protein
VDIGVRIVPLARFTSPPCVYGKEINQLPAHPYVCGAALRALVPKHAYFKSGKVYRQLVCFVNSGTSEMHFIAALDKVGGMRCVLGLFEGVTTEAADGYFRMMQKTGLHAAAPLAGPWQWHFEFAQRAESTPRNRQRRW